MDDNVFFDGNDHIVKVVQVKTGVYIQPGSRPDWLQKERQDNRMQKSQVTDDSMDDNVTLTGATKWYGLIKSGHK